MLKGSGSQKNINNENYLYDLEKPTGKATVWGGGAWIERKVQKKKGRKKQNQQS